MTNPEQLEQSWRQIQEELEKTWRLVLVEENQRWNGKNVTIQLLPEADLGGFQWGCTRPRLEGEVMHLEIRVWADAGPVRQICALFHESGHVVHILMNIDRVKERLRRAQPDGTWPKDPSFDAESEFVAITDSLPRLLASARRGVTGPLRVELGDRSRPNQSPIYTQALENVYTSQIWQDCVRWNKENSQA